MILAEKFGIPLALKLMNVCAKYTYKQLSNSYSFFSILSEFGIEYPKDEFNSIYLHTTLLFSSTTKPKELIELILLDDSQKAFKQEIYQNHDGAFALSLNSSLHTNPLVRELKYWNEIPKEYFKEFFKIYRELVKSVATPVQSQLLTNQETISGKIDQNQDELRQKIVSMTQILQDFSISRTDQSSSLQIEYDRQVKSIIKVLENGQARSALNQFKELKEAIWDKVNDDLKFKILTNIGVCYYQLGEIEFASNSLQEAYGFGSETEVGLSNMVNAFIAIDDHKKAKDYLVVFFQKFPTSPKAHAASIRLKPETMSVQEIESAIPEDLRENYEVLLSLGLKAKRLKDFNLSIKYLKTALESGSELPLVKEHLLACILEKYAVNFRVANLRLIDEETESELNEALLLTDELLSKYDKTELNSVTTQLYMNKSVVLNLLGHFDESLKEVNKALAIEPSNPKVLKQKGLIYVFEGDTEEAVQVLEEITNFSETPDVPSLLSEVYSKRGEFDKAIKILEEYLSSDLDQYFRNQSLGFLLELFIKTKQFEKVDELSKKEFKSNQIFDFVSRAHIARFQKSDIIASEILIDAISHVTDRTTARERFLLAEQLVKSNCLNLAIELFESIDDKTLYSPITIRLARLYYTVGRKGECLKLLQGLREKRGVHDYASSLEVSIYQEYGDYERAKLLAEEYLQSFSASISMKIRLAGVNLRLGFTDLVDTFLREDIEVDELMSDEFHSYLAQLMARNHREKLFKICYDYRRNHNDGEGHILFTQILLQFPLNEFECNPPTKVDVDTVVSFKGERGQSFTLVIEDRPKEELKENEIDTTDERFEIIKGKSVGEKISLPNSNVTWEIDSIANKLLHAFHESQKKCETLYVKDAPFKSFHVDDLPDFLNQIEKEGAGWQENFDLAKQQYRDRKAPLGTIAEMFGRNPIDIWNQFIHIENVGIQSSLGNNDELKLAIDAIEEKNGFCSDVVGLLTLFELDLGNVIAEFFGKVKIVSSTYDLIFDYIEENKIFSTRAQTTDKSRLELFFEFVRENCEVLPPQLAIDMNSNEKERLDELIGRSFFDTALLAKETNTTLLSDDLAFRGLIYQEYGVEGVWTQSILRYLIDNKKIDRGFYNEKVLKLTNMRYIHTAIDDNVLMLAAEKANFKYEFVFSSCLRFLTGKISSQNSSLLVAFGFLYRLWLHPEAQIKDKHNLTICTITTLCTDRVIQDIIEGLNYLTTLRGANDRSRSIDDWVYRRIKQEVKDWKKIYKITG
tara:strand:- start:76777 stop:80550 length:3774 start_codon:yes stop_codon:yes gene_type:complete